MNEPHRGYLELHSLYAFDANTDLQLGYHATAIQSFAIGDGYAQRIPYYVQSFPQPTKVSHHELVNQEGHRAWLKDRQCIWRQHGVWEWDNVKNAPVVMRQTYFERNPETGKPFEWYTDAWYPFVRRFAHAVTKGREQRRHWMTFAAGIPNEVRREADTWMKASTDVDVPSLRQNGPKNYSHRTWSRPRIFTTYMPCLRRYVVRNAKRSKLT